MDTTKLSADVVLQNRYRILSLLNRGGMGRVYLAEDMRFRSKVAVKEACLTKEEFRRAFAREARLLNRLRHQALPHVMDHFTEGAAQYLVMQFFPGKDLDELLNEKMRQTGAAFAVNQVLLWADQLLDALEYLHSHEPPIVHRDIKPQNLKLTEHGDVILLDFGLAKGVVAGMTQMSETTSESVPGYTRQYSPLEQILGKGTDPRSDLYALAASMYHLITGRAPADAMTRATATLGERPDPLRPANELNRLAPEPVAAALTRAMAQAPDERPATATEMRQTLRVAAQSQAPDYYAAATSTDRACMEIASRIDGLTTTAINAAKSPVTEITNAGRVVAQSPGPGVDGRGADAVFAWLRSGGGRTAGVVLSLLLPLIAALGYWRLHSLSGSSVTKGPEREAAITRPDGATPTPTPFVEAMRHYLEVESETGSVERVAGPEPVVRGRWLKFHFTPSKSGYLYIIAPGERATRVTFLTAQLNPAWGVKSNLLEAGIEYSFPPRPDKWVEIARGAISRTYIVIFTPEQLVQPRFLDGPAGHVLTAAEERELAELGQQFGGPARVERRDAQSIGSVFAERADGGPFLFEINLRLEAKEAGQK
ncbi:MAG TPA: protein kinase [Blastocatellia bacterium]|jgi:tRNA A-37 threonylcarbamoyl transferase component Bud32|nr:protein kinase [Blastocatellia bacterium]